MKRCTKCGVEKSVSEFRRKKGRAHEESHCKQCDAEYHRAYNKAHTDRVLELRRQKRALDPDKYRAARRAKKKRWVLAHPDQARAKKRAARQRARMRDPDKYRARRREAAQRRRARYPRTDEMRAQERARRKAWREAHPDENIARNREKRQKRRARQRGALVNNLSHAQWLEIQEVYRHRCSYCGKRAKGHLTQDHIVALAHGGDHTASNIVPACRSCNSRKYVGRPPVPVQPLLLTIAQARKRTCVNKEIEAA